MTASVASSARRADRSVDAPDRPIRRCVRCGREGRNAFRPMRRDATTDAWLCTHADPCQERARLQQRAAAKRAQGRPSQSPISGWFLDDRPVLVLGGDAASRAELATLLADITAAEVDCLGLDRRSLDLLGRRELGLVVADVRRGDPIAILNGLARRLARLMWRGVPIVVIHGPGDDGPAVEALVRASATHTLERPVDTNGLVSIVSGLASEPVSARAG